MPFQTSDEADGIIGDGFCAVPRHPALLLREPRIQEVPDEIEVFEKGIEASECHMSVEVILARIAIAARETEKRMVSRRHNSTDPLRSKR
jgi:hypothetical protein